MYQIKKGMQLTPVYGICCGPPGVGKTSFLGGRLDMVTGQVIPGAPKCVLIGNERFDEALCDKLPNAKTMDELRQQVVWIGQNFKKYGWKTVGIDSLDMVEKGLCWTGICERARVKSIHAVGAYGLGLKQAHAELTEFEKLVREQLLNKGLNVWYTAHTNTKQVSDPILGCSYDKYELTLHRSKNMDFQSIFVEKVSTVLFCNTKSFKNDDGYAIGTDQRCLYTQGQPGYLAKNRYSLPGEIDLDYNTFINHVRDFYNLGAQQ